MITSRLPKVVIIGKPNVGKSTIFNSIIGLRSAIESNIPMTTRDAISHILDWEISFELFDTAGIIAKETKLEFLEENVQLQAKIAIKNADLLVFVIDAKNNLTAEDIEIADIIRKSKKDCIFVANKSEGINEAEILNFSSIGLDVPLSISAINKVKLDSLKNKIIKTLKKMGYKKKRKKSEETKERIKIAFVGRPNVGKSSLQNKFFKEEKLITSEISGTTLDSIISYFSFNGDDFAFIDTAGIRRPGKNRGELLKKISDRVAKKQIKNCDIAVLLLDANEGITHRDLTIAKIIQEENAGFIIAINKWDLKEKGEEEINKFINILRARFFISWAPVVFISAKTGKNIKKVLEVSKEIYLERQKRIETGKLNNYLQKVMIEHPHPRNTREIIKVFYATQVSHSPPHFILFVNYPENFHFSYKRFLENKIREEYGFGGTNIKLEFRKKK